MAPLMAVFPEGGAGKGAVGGGVGGKAAEGPFIVESARWAGDIFSALARFNSKGEVFDRVISGSELLC